MFNSIQLSGMYIIFDWKFISKMFCNRFVTILEPKDVRNKLESGLNYVLFSASEYFKEYSQGVSVNWLAFEAFFEVRRLP